MANHQGYPIPETKNILFFIEYIPEESFWALVPTSELEGINLDEIDGMVVNHGDDEKVEREVIELLGRFDPARNGSEGDLFKYRSMGLWSNQIDKVIKLRFGL